MTITMLKGKIHRATVTQAELNYVGSITVDADLLELPIHSRLSKERQTVRGKYV